MVTETAPAIPPTISTGAMVDRLSRRVDELTASSREPSPRSAEAVHPARHRLRRVRRYRHALQRRKGTIALLCGLGVVIGGGTVLIPRPVYQARTVLEVVEASATPAEGANLLNQVSVLESRSLRKRVAAKLGIALPFRPGSSENWRDYLPFPALAPHAADAMISATADGVSIKTVPAARMIEITANSANPALAALYANTLATEFIDDRIESRWQAMQHAGDMLTRQLGELKTRLATSEADLQRYSAGTSAGLGSGQDKLGQLQGQISAAQGDRAARQARYNISSRTPVDSLGEVLDDEALRAIRQKLTDLRRELADLNSSMNPEYARTKRIQAQIGTLEAELEKNRSRILERIHSDLLAARTREHLLDRELSLQTAVAGDQAREAMQYNLLKQEVDSNREVYDGLLRRVQDTGVATAMNSGTFHVIDPAVAPTSPVGPSLPHGLLFGLLGGLLGGIGFVMVRQAIERSVGAPGETSPLLEAPELGVIPFTAPTKQSTTMLSLSPGSARAPELISYTQRTSISAEAFRVALLAVLQARRDGKPPRIIAVTSAGLADGKTTVACNLAIAVAEMNWSVLLIDADLRSPRLHGLFGTRNEKGLASILQGEVARDALPSLVAATEIPNLHVLPRGRLKGSPIDLLSGGVLPDLVAYARTCYDVIVIDTPALPHLTDARAVGLSSDGVVLVVRAGQTCGDAVVAAREVFAKAQIPVLGSVLNGWAG